MTNLKTHLKKHCKTIAKAGFLLTACCIGGFIGATIGTKKELSDTQFSINLISSSGDEIMKIK